MCLDSLPGCDRERGARWSALSLSGAAAGGVVAVFCTADSPAGEQPSPHVRLGAAKPSDLFRCLSLPRLITKVLKPTRVTLQFQDYHTFICSSELFLRYSPSFMISLSKYIPKQLSLKPENTSKAGQFTCVSLAGEL